MRDNKGIATSLSLPTILTLIFLVLKLCDVITWKWVFVFMPIIISGGLTILFFILKIVIAIVQDIRNK